ncbi:hypothetical protein MGYG_02199 [Nannizzia gypsea CBS 118893]|uniref:Uncharacterized protein n=1 Tax=Arthroderma gypseum (strain ATCC MYA-4604 / CBS 118893) TaxID=535722 RepID=E4UQA4_ARTGP|nr:hypothetical protein MGYG_02199 [Nannizzia gypsea CBS 118893]EFQ99185.1 hypothetical protein MGYG_02199 [Nannizzia gypsea CBS 118893]
MAQCTNRARKSNTRYEIIPLIESSGAARSLTNDEKKIRRLRGSWFNRSTDWHATIASAAATTIDYHRIPKGQSPSLEEISLWYMKN